MPASTTTRFCIAYAVGSASALLAYGLELLTRIGSPYATPEPAAAYRLLGGIAGGVASLVLGWLWGLVIERTSGRRQLFDLIADPGETSDLAATLPETAAALAARVGAPPRQEGPGPEEVARLRALGSIGY